MPGRAMGASRAWQRVPSAEPHVDERAGVVEAPAAEGGQPLRQAAYGGLVGEPDLGWPQPVAGVDVDAVGAVDHHVGDARQPEQRLERPGAEDVAAQRLVDGQHRGVADRAPGGPQRLGDPVGGQRARRSASRSRTSSTTATPARVGRVDAARPSCRAAQRGQVGEHAQRGAAERPARRAHRPEAEVDGLLEPALVGHLRGHRRPRSAGPRHRRSTRRRAAPAAAATGSRNRAHSRTAEASPATVGTVSTNTRSQRATSSSTSGSTVRGRSITTVSWPRWAAATALRTANAWRLPCGPGYQVSTPSPSRRGRASRSERPLNRPGRLAQRVPADAVVAVEPEHPVDPRPQRVGVDDDRRRRCARPSGRERRRTSTRPRRRSRRSRPMVSEPCGTLSPTSAISSVTQPAERGSSATFSAPSARAVRNTSSGTPPQPTTCTPARRGGPSRASALARSTPTRTSGAAPQALRAPRLVARERRASRRRRRPAAAARRAGSGRRSRREERPCHRRFPSAADAAHLRRRDLWRSRCAERACGRQAGTGVPDPRAAPTYDDAHARESRPAGRPRPSSTSTRRSSPGRARSRSASRSRPAG